jgi:hypothetical protein
LCKTTAGWWICVLWKNGETSWEHLADLKESNPLEVAAYSLAQGIDHEAAFCLWAPHVIKRPEQIISAVNNHYLKQTHKIWYCCTKNCLRCCAIGSVEWQYSLDGCGCIGNCISGNCFQAVA